VCVSKFLAVYVVTLGRQARLDVLGLRRAGAASSAAENEGDLYSLVGVRCSDNAGTGPGSSFTARYYNTVSFRHGLLPSVGFSLLIKKRGGEYTPDYLTMLTVQ
jgi:hypothetical protein